MGAKEAFARERAAINADHVKRARKLIAADALQETGLEISDTECQGLVLRVAHARRKASGDADEERELASAITLRHGIHCQRLELKADGMAVWVEALLKAYETEKALLKA